MCAFFIFLKTPALESNDFMKIPVAIWKKKERGGLWHSGLQSETWKHKNKKKSKKTHNVYSFFSNEQGGVEKLKALIFECLLLQILNFPLGFPSEYCLNSVFANF